MITGIDHVVLLVEDLAAAIVDATSSGFTVTPGGNHDAGGTHNALIAFSDGCFIELLAFATPPPPDGHYFSPRWQQGPGFADVAFRSTDIDLDVQAITDRGLPYPIPTHLARHRPDGVVASWRMSLPRMLHPGVALPFLVQDLSARSLRVSTAPDATTHPNGALGILGLSLVVADRAATVQSLSALLNQPAPATALFQASRGIASIPIDPGATQTLVIIQPPADSAPERYWQRFGDSIYSLSLRTRPAAVLEIGAGRKLSTSALGDASIYLQ